MANDITPSKEFNLWWAANSHQLMPQMFQIAANAFHDGQSFGNVKAAEIERALRSMQEQIDKSTASMMGEIGKISKIAECNDSKKEPGKLDWRGKYRPRPMRIESPQRMKQLDYSSLEVTDEIIDISHFAGHLYPSRKALSIKPSPNDNVDTMYSEATAYWLLQMMEGKDMPHLQFLRRAKVGPIFFQFGDSNSLIYIKKHLWAWLDIWRYERCGDKMVQVDGASNGD